MIEGQKDIIVTDTLGIIKTDIEVEYLAHLSDMFGFSSPAYFSRHVQQYLGIKPSDYRDIE